MAKLYFKYGAMGSSKSAQALMTRFNYIEKGKSVWLIKPSIDNRDGDNIIKSRIGLKAEATVIKPDDDIETMMDDMSTDYDVCDCVATPDSIIADEAQFFTEKQIEELRYIASFRDIPVICFGLRTDFQSKMFPGSGRLMELADSIAEIKSICKCGSKATVNARLDRKGNIILNGEQVDIGGDEKYEGMCWKCWQEKINQRH